MAEADIYRTAMFIIRDCGTECNPKDFAFTQASLFYEYGNIDGAILWTEIANAIDKVLEGVKQAEHFPMALQ